MPAPDQGERWDLPDRSLKFAPSSDARIARIRRTTVGGKKTGAAVTARPVERLFPQDPSRTTPDLTPPSRALHHRFLSDRKQPGAMTASPFALGADLRALLDDSRQNNVDLLRALAITAVFIHHGQHVFGGNVPFFGASGGWFGVQLFFVISGYLISASCEKHGLRDYAIHRFFRIVPAYLFFFLAIGIRARVVTAGAIAADPWAFIINLAFLQHLFPAALMKFDVLHVTWTLTVEVLWYVLAPLLLIGNRTLRWPTVLIAVLVSTAWVYMASTGALDFLYPGTSDTNPGQAYLFVVNHFLAQVVFFVFGAWIHFHRQAVARINPVLSLSLALLVFLALPYYLVFNPMFVTGIGIALLLVTALNSQPIRSRIVFWISETSYAIYLCHFPMMLWVRDRLGWEGMAGALAALMGSLILASLSYVLIERPFVRIGRRMTRSPPPKTAHEGGNQGELAARHRAASEPEWPVRRGSNPRQPA